MIYYLETIIIPVELARHELSCHFFLYSVHVHVQRSIKHICNVLAANLVLILKNIHLILYLQHVFVLTKVMMTHVI